MFGWKIQLGVVLALVAVLITLGLLYRAQLQKTGRLETTLARARADLADTEQQLRAAEAQRVNAARVAAQYKHQIDGIRAESRRLRDEIAKLEKQSAGMRDWADNDLPADVLDMLLPAGAPD